MSSGLWLVVTIWVFAALVFLALPFIDAMDEIMRTNRRRREAEKRSGDTDA